MRNYFKNELTIYITVFIGRHITYIFHLNLYILSEIEIFKLDLCNIIQDYGLYKFPSISEIFWLCIYIYTSIIRTTMFSLNFYWDVKYICVAEKIWFEVAVVQKMSNN